MTREERKNSKHYVNTTIFLELYVVPRLLDTFFFRWQPKEPNKQPKEKKFFFFFNGELRSVK